jgi:hypothetical protein
VTTASVFSPFTEYVTFRITPAESVGKRPLAGLAPISRNVSLPPRIRVDPFGSVSVVDRTTPRAFATDSIRALSSRPSVSSVNWMSTAIARGWPALIRLITFAWYRRGYGQRALPK